MVDNYTIYLVNNSSDTHVFWCFLEPPTELKSDPEVFANSNASLAIKPSSKGSNRFIIPAQYVVGAGAANNAVGLGIKVVSDVSENAELTDIWDATYATIPPNMGPELDRGHTKSPANTIAISSNGFDKSRNETGRWFSNQSFGIETDAGFIGMTWSPRPSQTRTLTPKLTFYIAIGTYGSNSLASWTEVSNGSQAVAVPGDFRYNESTVTYNSDGMWDVNPGPPPALLTADMGSAAISVLQNLANVGDGQIEKLEGVHWDGSRTTADGGTYLTGTITVSSALLAGFTYFVLGGTRFSITTPAEGRTRVHFSYSGDRSVEAVKSLFKAGSMLLFGGSE